ncbi:MAG: hypothetical protein K6D97_03990 [Clostridia bacterium]|nr:hypothetical protein [Clostridia bacterium]
MTSFLKALNQIRKPGDRIRSWRELKSIESSPELEYNDWKNMKADMQNFFKFVRYRMDKNPELSNEEICKEIEAFLHDTKIRVCSANGIRSNGIRLDLMNYFKANKARLIRVYDECIMRERTR